MERIGQQGRARLAGAAMAAAAGMALAASAGAPAHATEFDYNFAFNNSALRCGSFGLTVLCGESIAIPTAVQAQAGDVFKINLTSAQRIVVPGSPTESLFYVSAFDSQGTFGLGAPGGVLSTYQMTPQGFTAPAGQPAPIVGPFQQNRTNDYIGFVGYCCGYGEPDPNGFSLTGVTANLRVDAADPRATIGLSAGYVYQLSQLPTSFHDLPGGTVDSPVILPRGYVSQITGSISGGGPEEQFYNFNWQGGVFQAEAKILGADPNAVFTFELRSANGQFIRDLHVNALNDFDLMFSSQTSLAAGSYIIGLKGSTAFDPAFSLDFLTPVASTAGGIPEPTTWALLIAGFGGVGAALRRGRKAAAAAAA